MQRDNVARGRRAAAGASRAVVAVAAVVIALTGCQNWTQYMGSAALNGNAPGETTIGPATVTSVHEAWTMPLSSAANRTGVSAKDGQVYAASTSGLATFSLGSTNCSGSPVVCQPLWTAPAAPGAAGAGMSQPLVGQGVVYQSSSGINAAGDLRAFDAKGIDGCGGTPTVCQPLWSAAVVSETGPNLDQGHLFIIDVHTQRLEVFDANGVVGCSGLPRVCQPEWTAPVGTAAATPAVAQGKVYVTSRTGAQTMSAYDESGTTNCSGSPIVCQPLFTAPLPTGSGITDSSVDVSGGVAYVDATGGLAAVDASGVTGCSGSPVVCQPLWTAPNDGATLRTTPAVSNGRVYTAILGGVNQLAVWDAAGVTGCHGSPTSCSPIIDAPNAWVGPWSPLVSNGIVWAGGQAWDPTHIVGCPSCSPVWQTSFTTSGSAAIINGRVLVRDSTGTIHAYTP